MESLFRLVSGDYRGFVMIWEVEDIKEELVTLERRVKNLPKNGQSRGEGIFFIRPGSRLVQQQGRTDVAEVMVELILRGK